MANLEVLNSEIVRAALQQMGMGRDAGEMDAAMEADLRAVIRSGLRRFYFPNENGFTYQWRFLETMFSISVEDDYSTGTLTKTEGSAAVTLDGGTWPADIVDHYIDVENHILFVTERTSDTVVQVSHTQLAIAAETEYVASRYRYDLPSDFGEFLGGVVYANGTQNWMLVGSTESELKLRYAMQYDLNSETHYYAVSGGKIMFWPTPAEDAFIHGTYLAIPDDNLPADLTTPGSTSQVGPIYAEAVLEAVLAAAEAYNDDTEGIHEKRFQDALKRAINHDRAVGGHYDFSHQVAPDYRGLGPVQEIDFSDAI